MSMTLLNQTPFNAQYVVRNGQQIIARLPALPPGSLIIIPVVDQYEIVAAPLGISNSFSIHAVINGIATKTVTTTNPDVTVTAIIDNSVLERSNYSLTITEASGLLTSGKPADTHLRFIHLKSPETLPLYAILDRCTSIAEKQAAALAFNDLILDISSLPAPINRFPTLRREWLASLAVKQSVPNTRTQVGIMLGEEVEHFLASEQWARSQANVWQNLFVLSLIDNDQQSRLATQFVDVLRVGHFLNHLEGSDSALESPRDQILALSAYVVLPEVIAFVDPVGLTGQ